MQEYKIQEFRTMIDEMETDLEKWNEFGNKSACKRVRIACSKLAKEFKEMRKMLLEESKG